MHGVASILQEVMQTTDVEKRLELMQQMETIRTDTMPILPV